MNAPIPDHVSETPPAVMAVLPQVVRSLLRYLSGAMMTWGLLSAGQADALAGDPVLIELGVTALGAVIAAITEAWFSRAVKKAG